MIIQRNEEDNQYDVCPICGKEMINTSIVDFNDALSWVEYGISGMCQSCQDLAFNDEDEDEEEEGYDDTCPRCGKDMTDFTKDNFNDILSWDEFCISGLCQECQDIVYNEDEDLDLDDDKEYEEDCHCCEK